MDYFQTVLNNLTEEDIVLLNALHENNSYSKYTAIDKFFFLEQLNISVSIFRKSITKLESLCFVEIVNGKRKHMYFLSEFGEKAIQNIIEGVEQNA
ncbi:hypothetical protein [Bacillus smithii]|uniref:hypothetical protein n=1 Tax=Bacillus smithii TaxID=1479 RepID=UPI003D20479D